MPHLRKYPRTPHIEGSRLQPGDEDLSQIPFAALAGRHLVVEEKMDGANAAISFGPDGALLLQSRGHYLVGGPRERHFDLLKRWAHAHAQALWQVLGDRYVLYGEWLYAKHTMFYDQLPHYFLEFDVLDTYHGTFLSTARRRVLLHDAPTTPVPVLYEGTIAAPEQLLALLGPSLYVSRAWRDTLRQVCEAHDLDYARALRETDSGAGMEGLYIKVEEGAVQERFKYVRATFLAAVLQSETHWLDRPIVPNQLRPGVDIFRPSEGVE
jgi:hypothetical protein